MKNGMKKLLLSSAMSALLITSSASFAKPVSSKDVLTNYATITNVVFKDPLTTAQTLQKTVNELTAKPSDETLNTAKAEKEDGLSAQLRFGFTNTEDGAGADDKTTAIGGNLGFITPSRQGFSAGGKIYATTPIGDDSDGLFLASDGDGYAILGEAWGQAVFASTLVKLGRQTIDTPFADTDDIGIIPNTFQGVVISNTSLANTTIIATHLDKWSGVDAGTPEKFRDMNGSKGVNALGVVYEKDQWTGQLWHYNQKNATNISYGEVGVSPLESLELGLQYTTQKDHASGGTGKAWGAMASYSVGELALSADYNKASGVNGVVNGFGGGPYFSSSENNTIDGVAGIRANAIGAEYSGIKNLTLGIRKVDFNKGVGNELDINASYQIRDNITADLIVSDMEGDGKNTRFFVNYDVGF